MSSTTLPRQPAPTGPTGGITTAPTEVRCSRCQLYFNLNKSIQFGMNSYYCMRCASMVGYKR